MNVDIPKLYICDDCESTMFEGEERCAMCGYIGRTESTMPPLERYMLLRVAGGASIDEVMPEVADMVLDGVMREYVRTLLENAVRSEEFREAMRSRDH